MYFKGVLEDCCTELCPNYNHRQSRVVVGVYRPPESKHPTYSAISVKILAQ